MSAPLVVGAAGAILVLALPVIAANGAHEARARAQSASDAAALAAADAMIGLIDTEPCALAAGVLAHAEVALEMCDLDSANDQVRVRASVQTIFGTVYVRTRAGSPVP